MLSLRGSCRLTWLCAWLALGACATPAIQHPQLQSRLAGVQKIALVPVQASVIRIVFTGENEQLQGETDAARAAVARAAEQQVRARGLEFAPLRADERAFQSDPELAFQLTLVQVAADAAMQRALQGSPKSADTLSGTRTVLAETDRLARLVGGADALLFARYIAWEKSGGEVAKDIAASAVVYLASMGTVFYYTTSSPIGAIAVVCLVDARTGEVLYANQLDTDSDIGASMDPYEITMRALEQLEHPEH